MFSQFFFFGQLHYTIAGSTEAKNKSRENKDQRGKKKYQILQTPITTTFALPHGTFLPPVLSLSLYVTPSTVLISFGICLHVTGLP